MSEADGHIDSKTYLDWLQRALELKWPPQIMIPLKISMTWLQLKLLQSLKTDKDTGYPYFIVEMLEKQG